jgi:hypothetical protein
MNLKYSTVEEENRIKVTEGGEIGVWGGTFFGERKMG